jgi:hypothetical protein
MTEIEHQTYEHQWHLDRKVPIALIVALAAQTSAISWWAATLSARVDLLERQLVAIGPQAERIIRLESKVDGITGGLWEIKTLIDRRPELRR